MLLPGIPVATAVTVESKNKKKVELRVRVKSSPSRRPSLFVSPLSPAMPSPTACGPLASLGAISSGHTRDTVE